MYDELITLLRDTDFSDGCPCGAENLCKDNDCIIWQAADAIEELQGKTKILEKIADYWCKRAIIESNNTIIAKYKTRE